AQTQITISMASPPAAPRILGPQTIGILPQSDFLYMVAASGQRPITFAASGLPAGLTIDSSTGRITGTSGAPGRIAVNVTATNGAGNDQQTLTLVVGSTLALTPPMGWNSYDSYNDAVTESDLNSQAQVIQRQLQPSGWQYLVIDYRWYDPKTGGSLAMDTNGRLLPAPNRFPSATGSLGFKPLADAIHAMGLHFGIHIMRGIPRQAHQANSPIAGSTYHAADAANTSDLCPWNSDMYGVNASTAAGQAWYDSIFQQYAQWGIDLIKVDDLLNNQVTPNVYHQGEVDIIRASLAKTGRSIILSLSPGEMPVGSATNLEGNANMWRMANDFWDVPSHLDHMFALAYGWQAVNSPGHWPDADMLPLGYLGPNCPVAPGNRNTRFTKNEQVTMMSFWSVLPSPLLLGADMTRLQTDAWTTALLTNEEVLAINQDSMGQRARNIGSQGMQEIWTRDLSGGRKAVGLFNHAVSDQSISVTWAQLGISGAVRVRDVWQRADIPVVGSGIALNVPYRGASLLVVGPAPVTDAGVTDAGVIDASGSDAGTGASSSDGASGNGIGASDGAGRGGSSGGNTGVESGSSAEAGNGSGADDGGSGGVAAGRGASVDRGIKPSSTTGCGCGAVGREGGGVLGSLALVGLLAFGVRRRRMPRG
ncbi:MAG: putative Ig domain-containing protein, partial [Myxococcota bacterium]|nr:putative Ig domain-containing protein [Myxococcota bacterium]